MSVTAAANDPLRPIIGEKLSAVVFVLDYWQLQFDGPTLTVLTCIEVRTNGTVTRNGDDQFRNHLCGQIGKIVEAASMATEVIAITFADQSSIEISMRDRDYRGPEAAYLCGPDEVFLWVVRHGEV
jgi:hypothetical protein